MLIRYRFTNERVSNTIGTISLPRLARFNFVCLLQLIVSSVLSRGNEKFYLRTLPTIVTVHIFCVCEGSRAQRERNTQHAGHADWVLSPVSLGGSSYFLWKDVSFFNRWKIISIYLVSSFKTEEVCACCYFCRMIDLTEHFIVTRKSF